MVVLYLEEKGSHDDSFVSKGVQSVEDLLQLLPAFFIQNASLSDFDGLIVVYGCKIGTIDKEDVQELQQSELITELMG